ncbi:rac GTPase-activating protein 1-like isoform X1 [Crassostrea virginica]|uniref:Rac GTPase-activating protein 1-like isoform X2 n=1 Tax=Crassostrea virginica TaxID=6565 RepID=A0A8B8BR20_CRAVI|nr:rac GTPase-activating protein 1-like isoform X2 [Crassostrea virginica]
MPKLEGKLSLLATYDDIMRKSRVLKTGDETEFRRFVQNQEQCRIKWHSLEVEVESLQERIRRLEAENSGLTLKLKHARGQIEEELEKRQFLEHERDEQERQIGLIRELLNDRNGRSTLNEQEREKLFMLSTTHRSHLEGSPSKRKSDEYHQDRKRLRTINESAHSMLSDDEYDKTEDDLHTTYLRSGRRFKRPSAPPLEEDLPKKRKSGEDRDNSIITTTTVTIGANGAPVAAETEVKTVKTLNKSFSEPALDKHMPAPSRDADSEPESEDSYYGTPRNNNNKRRKSRGILKTTPSETPVLRKAHSASKGLNRVHVFMSKTVIKPENCVPCGKRIKFGKLAMKCKDCRSTCHPDCKDNLPLPCIPLAPGTPGGNKLVGGIMSDYAPLERPMIPAIVVHCVNEVEARGLNEVGIYRLSGSDSQVKELKKEFMKGKGVPNLSHIDDIHVVCGCMKDFLRGLKEPLVTFGLWKDFVGAAENRDRALGLSEMYQAISQLPQANKDTLAFLILHLLRVGDIVECKMPLTNLAKVFGPTIVGYSVPDPEPLQMINETKYQAMVMEKLFEIPVDYWESYLNVDEENIYPNQYNTPQTPDGAMPHSRLGPLHTPGSHDVRSKTWGKSSFTPKFSSKSNHVTKKPSHFFSSPKLH